MIPLHWLHRCDALVLMLAVGATSGCINSEKFTSGRMPYGSADQLAATTPRDPFLTGNTAPPREQRMAATASTTQPTSYAAAASAPTGPAPNYGMPASPPQLQAPQYAMHAQPAGTPMTDLRQAAYTPSEGNPFNSPQAASAVSQPMPPQRPGTSSGSAIEQISYEMPVRMPAGAVYEANPFAEVEGQPTAAYPVSSPQMGATDAWQPNPSSSRGFAGTEFLPPR